MISRIEPLARKAAGPISLLHRTCFPDDPWDVGAIEQVVAMPCFFGQVGWTRSTPVGFALALMLGEEADIVSLGVLPDYRRCGMGSRLLDAISGEARSQGAESAVLEVARDNEAACALYVARGFIVVGCRRNYYRRAEGWVDALIMRVSL